MTFLIVTEGEGKTSVFVGREAKTLGDVKIGATVMVVYKKTDKGDVALVIRVMGEGGKKGEGRKKEGGERD